MNFNNAFSAIPGLIDVSVQQSDSSMSSNHSKALYGFPGPGLESKSDVGIYTTSAFAGDIPLAQRTASPVVAIQDESRSKFAFTSAPLAPGVDMGMSGSLHPDRVVALSCGPL